MAQLRRQVHRLSSIDDAIEVMHWLQCQIDERLDWLLDHKMRKITPGLGCAV
jgi:hypothetical protein